MPIAIHTAQRAILESYVNNYNQLTALNGKAITGAQSFRVDKDLLDSAGYKQSNSLLDYGCGWGSLLTVINPSKYIGVDISPLIIELVKQEFTHHDFRIHNVGKSYNGKFDFVVAHSVFTHIPKKIVELCLSDIKGSLKSDGVALIDIFSQENINGNLLTTYSQKEWLEILLKNGLFGSYLTSRTRNGFFIHNYYKVKHAISN